jgi:hypothetical protein
MPLEVTQANVQLKEQLHKWLFDLLDETGPGSQYNGTLSVFDHYNKIHVAIAHTVYYITLYGQYVTILSGRHDHNAPDTFMNMINTVESVRNMLNLLDQLIMLKIRVWNRMREHLPACTHGNQEV